jgi:hypothetical protein
MKAHLGAGVAVLFLALAGCASDDANAHADAVTQAACRQRADEVFAMRHPDATYNADTYASSLRDSPFGTSGSPSLPTAGLSDSYEREKLLRDCLAGNGPIGPTPAAPPP